MAAKQDMKRLIKAAEKAGWTVTLGRSGHLKWRSPEGAMVVSCSTPSDHRAIQNHLALLRKAGLDLKGGSRPTASPASPQTTSASGRSASRGRSRSLDPVAVAATYGAMSDHGARSYDTGCPAPSYDTGSCSGSFD